jgi:D-alanine transaminase
LEEGAVSVEDRGFQFGDGVYEVIKIMNGRSLWWEEHLERLQTNLRLVRMPDALHGHELGSILRRLMEFAGLGDGLAYVQVTRGAGARDFFFPAILQPTVVAYVRAHVFAGEREIRAGIALHLVQDIRWSRCDIKSVNLLPAVLAKQEARDAGCREALWVGEGVAREGASSNFFAVVEGVLRTHPADNRILDGITRRNVLGLAQAAGVEVREKAVDMTELAAAEEAFIASTTNDVMPVTAIGGKVVGGSPVPGPITLRLANLLRARAASQAGLPPPRPLEEQ